MDSAREEMESLRIECVHLKEESPRLGDKFRYYQDLRGYVTDLVECLDEKVGLSFVTSPGAGHLAHDLAH
jgi:GC-rich sequence DNA-binding factor